MGFRRLLDYDALGDGELTRVEPGDGAPAICLARSGDSVFAVQAVCSHAEYPLEDGSIEGDAQVECMLHGAVFDLRDGSVQRGPATEPLKTYPVRVEDGGIWVDLEADER